MCWGPPKRKSKNYHIRQLTKWRRERQRQRRKSLIWLVECGRIIGCCTCGTLFGAIFWRSLPNDDVKFSYLSFWRQHEPAAMNLSFSASTWKPFVPIKWKHTSSILFGRERKKCHVLGVQCAYSRCFCSLSMQICGLFLLPSLLSLCKLPIFERA